jgi:hypothetical protein
LRSALASGEFVEVVRTGSTPPALVGTATVSGLTWQFTPPSALAAGVHSFQARVADAAGNRNTPGTSRSVTIDTSVPLANAAAFISTVNGATPKAGAVPVSNNATPTLAGTIQRPLLAGEQVRIYRNGSAAGGVGASGTSWSYTSLSLATGTYDFFARVEQVENSEVFGASSATVSVPIDVTPPVSVTSTSAFSDVSNTIVAINLTSNDPTPTIRMTLGGALGAGEGLVVTRQRGTETSVTLSPSLRSCGTNCQEFDDGTVPVTMSVPNSSPSSGLPSATFTYRAQVRDAAGNTGGLALLAFQFSYTPCAQSLATTAYSSHAQFNPVGQPPTNCNGCHVTAAAAGGSLQNKGSQNSTPSGAYVAVPSTVPAYWCTRP